MRFLAMKLFVCLLDVVVSGTDSLSETKKMKLLLDINVLPDRKFEVVSARNLSAGEKKMGWLPWDRFVEMMAYYLVGSNCLTLYISRVHWTHGSING